MPDISVHPTPHGRPAAQLLRDLVADAKQGDPLQPVTVVVPTNYVGVSTRRLLAGGELGQVTATGDGIAGLNLLTVYRLGELLGAARLAAVGRRPVSTPVIAAAVRRALREDAGVFAPVREHPSTEEALVLAHRELSEVRPASLDVLAAASDRAADVVRLHRAIRAALEPDWFEESDLMAAAVTAVEAGSPVLPDLGRVIVHLPQLLSLPAAHLLRVVAEAAPVHVVAGRTGSDRADADVDRSLRRLGVTPPAGPAAAGPPAAPAADPASHPPVTPATTRVISVSDAEEEVRSGLRSIIDAARRGVPLERMALLYPSPEPYARIVDEQLTAAGIAANGRAVRPLTDRLLGRWLLDLLGLRRERYSRPAVMGLLAGAPVVDGRGGIPAGPWERISRDAGVVRDRGEWQDKLTHHAEQSRRRAAEEAAAEDPRGWLVDRLTRDAEQAERLRRFVGALVTEVEAAHRLTCWADLADWCRRMARRHLGDERQRERWPTAEQDAAERVEEALDRLAALDAVEEQTTPEVFGRALELELDADLGRVGAFGQGVLVGTPTAALGIDLDLVVVLGLAEGVFPSRPREDSLLPDSERERIADELRPRADHAATEHRHLLAALAASSGERVLVHPRGDLRRSVQREPSRWLLDAVEVLRGDGVRELPEAADWLEVVPSFAARVRTSAFPATHQEYGLRALAPVVGTAGLDAHPLVRGDAGLRRGVALALGRRSEGFTRFDGNLSHLAEHLPSPAEADRAISPSQIEAWLSCPHAHLLQYVLKVDPVENPEELLEIDARERGSLVHDVLEAWLLERLDEPLPAPGTPWPAEARRRLAEIAEAACADAEERGVTGRGLLWRRDRRGILFDLRRFAEEDDVRRAELGLTPTAAEMAFGLPGAAAEAVVVDLGDGRTVRVRGRIDRIDRAADGTVVVADYKTGGTTSYQGLGEESPLGDGTKLQLAVYGLAVRQADPSAERVRSEYWFTSAKGGFKRIGYDLTDEVVEELRRALRITVEGIEQGLFPMKPAAPGGWGGFIECRYCDPDELGTAGRYRDWGRVRRAPELRSYLELVESDLAAALDEDGQAEGAQAKEARA